MLRVKREYQSWVANESLEDYALRYAARSYRRWSPSVVANTAIGGISFLALEAIGASITISYGFYNALPAILIVSFVIFAVSLPIAYWSSVANVDIDLLTRGAGFGFVGSTVTSLIYASFTFIFFAIETAIWAQALELAIGLNIVVGYLLCSLVIIPIVFFGVTLINKLQAWTQPIWILMLVLPFAFILYKDPSVLSAWAGYLGADGASGGFDLLLFGAATGVLFSLVAQIGEQADYLRFLPERDAQNRRGWWLAMLSAGPGWIVIGGLKILAGSLLAVLAVRAGASAAEAIEPIRMYIRAYEYVFDDRLLVLALATVFVTISQVKINVTNAYSGSLAWSNCFARLAHYHPGRVVWLVFNVLIALLLSLLGIFATLEAVLSVYSTVAIAWIGALVADLVVLKRTGISPPYIEFKRAHLYNVNPVGCGAMLIASAVSLAAYIGAFGPLGQAFFGFIALAVAFVSAIAIAYLTRGKYYIARPDVHYRQRHVDALVECCICERSYEAADMAHCPFYRGPICSLCCGLELHCRDFCKQPSVEQAIVDLPTSAAPKFQPQLRRRVGRFLGLFSIAAALLGAAFLLTYRLVDLTDVGSHEALVNLLVRLYVATLVVSAMGTWWIVLSHESQEQSERELLQSLHYLELTRKELVESEKLASLGGLVAGVAHEINTPVGIAVSTASYLSDRTASMQQAMAAGTLEPRDTEKYLRDAAQSAQLLLSNARRAAQLVQSFKQLAVDQVSDDRHRFDLAECIDETVLTLRPKLVEAGATLRIDCPRGIIVEGYPGPLAQVLTNLIVNALQHAFEPPIKGIIAITARHEVDDELTLLFTDNGKGVPQALHEKIFEPFFTTRRGLGGSGLGLFIVHSLVTRKLNGSIHLESGAGGGTTFTIRMPRVVRPGAFVAHIMAGTPRATSG
jgi:signal transduction histidine kinase/purine-cytosine permease-like protein